MSSPSTTNNDEERRQRSSIHRDRKKNDHHQHHHRRRHHRRHHPPSDEKEGGSGGSGGVGAQGNGGDARAGRVPQVVIPRSAEQSSRLLLSSAFRYDTMEAEQNRKHIQDSKQSLLTVKLQLLSLYGLLAGNENAVEGRDEPSPTSPIQGRKRDGAGGKNQKEKEEGEGMAMEEGKVRTGGESEGREKKESRKKWSLLRRKEKKKMSNEEEGKRRDEKTKGESAKRDRGGKDFSPPPSADQASPSSTTTTPFLVSSAAGPSNGGVGAVPSSSPPIEVNISIFDPALKLFVTSAYRLSLNHLKDEPIVFQATPQQLLVVELLSNRNIPLCVPLTSLEEEKRVVAWGCFAMQSLEHLDRLPLCAGNGQLLYMDAKLWPLEASPKTKGKVLAGLTCVVQVGQDRALARLLTELVPPGLIVPYSFAMDTPYPHGSTFQVEIEMISLQPSSHASEGEREELVNENIQWSIAVVAHNGYQQLSEGEEVPLRFPRCRRRGRKEKNDSAVELKGLNPSGSTSFNEKGAGSHPMTSSLYSTGSYTSYEHTSTFSSTTLSSDYSSDDDDDDEGRRGRGGDKKKSSTRKRGGEKRHTSSSPPGSALSPTTNEDGESGATSGGSPTKTGKSKSRNNNKHQLKTGGGSSPSRGYLSTMRGTPFKGLESAFPIIFTSLPIHASTSLVLAIRRRRLTMTTASFPSSSPPPPSFDVSAHAEPATEVLGFCVFPVCLLPMKDRDLRVENLPALQGPFSCQDPRMLLAESGASSYGHLPFTVTLSLAFRGTEVPGERTIEEDKILKDYLKRAKEEAVSEKKRKAEEEGEGEGKRRKETDTEEDEGVMVRRVSLKGSKPAGSDGKERSLPRPSFRGTSLAKSVDEVPVVRDDSHYSDGASNAESGSPPVSRGLPPLDNHLGSLRSPKSNSARSEDVVTSHPSGRGAGEGERVLNSSDARAESIFEFLNRIMKELHEVRVRQDELFEAMVKSSSSRFLSSALQARVNARLVSSSTSSSVSVSGGVGVGAGRGWDDKDAGVTIIDLRPVPVAVPWQVRHEMTEAAQPIMHPILPGHTLCDFSPADRQHTRSLFGFRLEGLTLDAAFPVPEDVCFMFSFGPLPFQKVGPARTIPISPRDALQQKGEVSPYMNVLLHQPPHASGVGQQEGTGSPKDRLFGGGGGAVGARAIQNSFRLVDAEGRGGFVWIEPVDTTPLCIPPVSMESFKHHHAARSVLYLHVYDALTMFYICTAPIPFSHFYRPYHAEAALIPMDLSVQRDLSLTAQPVQEGVFPMILHAGQLHLTLVCVGAPPAPSFSVPPRQPTAASSCFPGNDYREFEQLSTTHCLHRLVEPHNGSRLILAKKLPSAQTFGSGMGELSSAADRAQAEKGATSLGFAGNAAGEGLQTTSGSPPASGAPAAGGGEGGGSAALPPPLPPPPLSSMAHHRHWQRAEFFKKAMRLQRSAGVGPTPLPGVPDEHLRKAALRTDPITMEYRLRLIERERDVAKSRAITTALKERITVRHEIYIASWRPEVLQTPFQNPFHTAVNFSIDIPSSDFTHCSTTSRSLILAPKEKTSIPLVVRLHDKGLALSAACHEEMRKNRGEERVMRDDGALGFSLPVVKLLVKVYAPQRQLIRIIEIMATILPPQVDRRLELYGPPGISVNKSFFSREYSSCLLPDSLKKASLPDNTVDTVSRLSKLCAAVTCSSPETTSAKTVAMLDPITQHYITAWEEVEITTTVPKTHGEQRVEYLTLYQDAACTQTLEVWELCVFPCFAIITREIPWGQTTTIALPADQSEDMYCSNPKVTVEYNSASYLLHLCPTAVGNDKMLLHTLQDGALIKTLLTVPVVYPTPSATQVIELSFEDIKSGPVQRRLTFVNRGDKEEWFTIRQNYTYQLFISPSRFLLAPGDAQPIHLRIGPLALPDGQQEGRWPMWVFINNASDKTIESYYLQVVLRLHHVVPHVSKS